MSASAESIATALEGRRTTGGWRARCPAHADKHPSLDIAERDGRALFVCRAGCSQRDVIDALTVRGLWSAGDRRRQRPIRDPFPASAFREPTTPPPPCCMQGPPYDCEHWRAFDRGVNLAAMRHDLFAATSEIVELFRKAGYPLTRTELRGELKLAVEVGAVTTCGLDDETQDATIAKLADEITGVLEVKNPASAPAAAAEPRRLIAIRRIARLEGARLDE